MVQIGRGKLLRLPFRSLLFVSLLAAFPLNRVDAQVDSTSDGDDLEKQAVNYHIILHDMKMAALYYEKACIAGNASSCFDIGSFYAGAYVDNGGIKPDRTKAIEFYTMACKGGNTYGCNEAARLSRPPQSVPERSVANAEANRTAQPSAVHAQADAVASEMQRMADIAASNPAFLASRPRVAPAMIELFRDAMIIDSTNWSFHSLNMNSVRDVVVVKSLSDGSKIIRGTYTIEPQGEDGWTQMWVKNGRVMCMDAEAWPGQCDPVKGLAAGQRPFFEGLSEAMARSLANTVVHHGDDCRESNRRAAEQSHTNPNPCL